LQRQFRYYRDIFVTVACVALILETPQGAFAQGREGFSPAQAESQ
jgi:hypothetical protein